jgi:hypothetical protein
MSVARALVEILVDGTRVGEQTIERRGPLRFFDAEYVVPAELVKGKQKVTVKFQAVRGNEVGCVFGIRMIRDLAEWRVAVPRNRSWSAPIT